MKPCPKHPDARYQNFCGQCGQPTSDFGRNLNRMFAKIRNVDRNRFRVHEEPEDPSLILVEDCLLKVVLPISRKQFERGGVKKDW